MPRDEEKVVSGLAQPARSDIPLRKPAPVAHFDADGIRAFPKRPRYERAIELAAWEGKTEVVISYKDNRLAIAVSNRLRNLGFAVESLKSRNAGTEYYFRVTW